MWVRAYDKDTNQYFKSEVFAKFNTGWFEKFLVKVPSETGDYLKLIDSLDKSKQGPVYPVNINPIAFKKEDWITKKEVALCEYNRILPDVKFDFFWGYAWVFENKKLVCDLLQEKTVLCSEIDRHLINISTKLESWNYVENNHDIDTLFKEFGGFHDCILKDLHYISGSFKDGDSIMPLDHLRRITITFENDHDSIEMVFEGVTSLNLRPAQDNYDSIIFEATIIAKDATIFFCNDHLEKEEYPDGCTCIKAYSLRWRRI